MFIRGTGQHKVAPCTECGRYPRFSCKECYGTGETKWVELKDFRSGHVGYFVQGVDLGEF